MTLYHYLIKNNFNYSTKLINVSDIDYNSLQNVGGEIIEDFL